MKVSQLLLQKTLDQSKENYKHLDRKTYSIKLHKVIDVLATSSPLEWIAIGETIMKEGAYQIIATKEGRRIPYDTANQACGKD